ncbi:MAG TPA: polysaccharide deacetylase family protein [Pyrinomonadaceae bacterium]|nr:polysaccharide deacetylase family protein [Pyrinomonadaceae bacterium]
MVISLDFELSWGVRDFLEVNPAYAANIEGEGKAVRSILRLFEEFEVAATWATVGLVFAESAEQARAFQPVVLPDYDNPALSPFGELTDETSNGSQWFAPNLIDEIRDTPRQEVATHTFSHYYCRESGQTAEAFAADITSAKAIAEQHDIALKAIVFPRNQHNPAYDDILAENGISCYRGNQRARMYQFDGPTLNNKFYRMSRLLDTYFNVSGKNTFGWGDLKNGNLINVPASIFLRPVKTASGTLQNLQFRRIAKSMMDAARNNRLFHLWWHPHNFGVNLEQNLTFLTRVLNEYSGLRERYGMLSLTMSEVANRVEAE